MAKVYTGDNPTQLYMDAYLDLQAFGNEVAPRGKRVKELRPVVIEFTNPLNRVTFLEGRKVNPFFQMAEALWILAGRSDVEWLTKYNRNMAQFSDDGENFNAPYGERLRFWNKNNYRDYVYNPIDQLVDVYEKIKADTDTRQAVAVIYNPAFDNFSYGGKDTPCNLILTFKVRDGKLDLTVFNRSNDLHWGTFGANLCQFSSIQEVMASWLDLPVGTYNQITDSLHIYLDDYGAKENVKINKTYFGDENYDLSERMSSPAVKHFTFDNEPRMSASIEEFQMFLQAYFNGGIDEIVHDDNSFMTDEGQLRLQAVFNMLEALPDKYLQNTVYAMVAYRAHRLGNFDTLIKALSLMDDSQWKLSCLYFLYNSYKDKTEYRALYKHFDEDKKRYIEGKSQRKY
jgi:thymidylate synthase